MPSNTEHATTCKKYLQAQTSLQKTGKNWTKKIKKLFFTKFGCTFGKTLKATIMAESTSTPYNIREKQEKNAAYRSLIRAELADELYDKILNIIIVGKRYRDKDFSAKDLAVELGTNTRYISAVINSRFNTNFSCLVNEYRIKEAQHRLTDKRFQEMTIEEIGKIVGFANRQSFYASFYRVVGETPNNYRRKHTIVK